MIAPFSSLISDSLSVVMEQVEGIRIASRTKDSSFDGKRTTKTTIGPQLTVERLLIKNERKDQEK